MGFNINDFLSEEEKAKLMASLPAASTSAPEPSWYEKTLSPEAKANFQAMKSGQPSGNVSAASTAPASFTLDDLLKGSKETIEVGRPTAQNMRIPESVGSPETKRLSVPQVPQEMSAPAPADDKSAMVKEQIMKKFNLGEYGDDARKKLVDDNSQYDLGGRAQAALAALGAGFMGQNAMAAGNAVLDRQKGQKTAKLAEFDKGRSNKIQEFGLDREATKASREDDLLARETDPTSQESKMAQDLAVSMGYKGDPSKITAEQFKQFSPAMSKKYEIEQRKLDRTEARDERRFQHGVKVDEKRAEKARPSDKQIEAFSDLDNATSDLNNLLSSLGDKSGWTGPTDGRIPDMMVGDDQVAWRSAVGKYKDAYRKAITGAGAGPTEIAILEKRLPNETDTHANFIAKAEEAKKELLRRKEIMADNLTKGGKDVSKFAAGSKPQSDFPRQVRKDGKVATVSNQSELEEASSEGWK